MQYSALNDKTSQGTETLFFRKKGNYLREELNFTQFDEEEATLDVSS